MLSTHVGHIEIIFENMSYELVTMKPYPRYKTK